MKAGSKPTDEEKIEYPSGSYTFTYFFLLF